MTIKFIYGMSGCAKTTTAIASLKRVKNFTCIAFTHSAVNNLKDKYLSMFPNTKIRTNNFQTIHKFLRIKPSGPIVKHNHVLSQDVIIVDEFSLIPLNIINYLFEIGEHSKTVFVFVGDFIQLPPISEVREPINLRLLKSDFNNLNMSFNESVRIADHLSNSVYTSPYFEKANKMILLKNYRCNSFVNRKLEMALNGQFELEDIKNINKLINDGYVVLSSMYRFLEYAYSCYEGNYNKYVLYKDDKYSDNIDYDFDNINYDFDFDNDDNINYDFDKDEDDNNDNDNIEDKYKNENNDDENENENSERVKSKFENSERVKSQFDTIKFDMSQLEDKNEDSKKVKTHINDKDKVKSQSGRYKTKMGEIKIHTNMNCILITNIDDDFVNGDIVIVRELLENNYIYISNIQDDKRIIISAKSILPNNFITCHKAQGRTIPKVILILDGLFEITMLYTAITRASEDIKFIKINHLPNMSDINAFKTLRNVIYKNWDKCL